MKRFCNPGSKPSRLGLHFFWNVVPHHQVICLKMSGTNYPTSWDHVPKNEDGPQHPHPTPPPKKKERERERKKKRESNLLDKARFLDHFSNYHCLSKGHVITNMPRVAHSVPRN